MAPSNGGSVLTGCRRLSFLLTDTGPNELKIIPSVQKTILYENIAAIVMNDYVFGSSRAAKSAVLVQGWQFLAVSPSTFVHFIVCLYSSVVLNVLRSTLHIFLYKDLVLDNQPFSCS